MSGCADVCLDMNYDGYNDFFHEKQVVARKQHKCVECALLIGVGSTYERVSGKSDGTFWVHATCGICVEIRKAFVCGSWIYGELFETIEAGMFPIWKKVGPYDCLAKLTTESAIQVMNARYREWEGV